jgi:hypothetical protein
MDRDAGLSCSKITEAIVATAKDPQDCIGLIGGLSGRLSDPDLEVFDQRHTRLIALGAHLGISCLVCSWWSQGCPLLTKTCTKRTLSDQ